MRITLTVVGILQLWLTLEISYNEAVVFKMTNAVCESFNKSWVVIHKCRLRAINRHRTTFNFNGTILHPANDISLRLEVFQKANGYKPWLFNVTIDVCRFFRKKFNPFAIIIFRLFTEYSNLNHTCPYMGPQIVDGLFLRREYLPHSMPSGEYLLGMTWFFDRKPQFIENVYYVFKEDR